MTDRFRIEDYGIWDKWRGDKKLNWLELCNTLNTLDNIADKNLDEYNHIIELEYEIEELKQELSMYKRLFEQMKTMADDMMTKHYGDR